VKFKSFVTINLLIHCRSNMTAVMSIFDHKTQKSAAIVKCQFL